MSHRVEKREHSQQADVCEHRQSYGGGRDPAPTCNAILDSGGKEPLSPNLEAKDEYKKPC
ncbi:MAG TPA: hypothetical protein VGO47_15065 [Chlamydiales bacterium]|nr:hypothetical protein [Chlamydiales bacterium]